jgi:hypothetical protein
VRLPEGPPRSDGHGPGTRETGLVELGDGEGFGWLDPELVGS